MDMVEGKMSKSKAESCLFIHDDKASLEKKLKAAFCPADEIRGNPVVDILKYIIFPQSGEFHIKRPEKWGGDIHYETFEDFTISYLKGDLHPLDLKMAVAQTLVSLMEPIQEVLIKEYGSLEAVENMDFLI